MYGLFTEMMKGLDAVKQSKSGVFSALFIVCDEDFADIFCHKFEDIFLFCFSLCCACTNVNAPLPLKLLSEKSHQ